MPLGTLYSMIGALAVMAGIGVGLSRFIHFRDEVKHAFVTVIVNVAMPCIIVHSLFLLPFDTVLLQQMLLVLLLSVGFHSLGIVLGWAGSYPLGVSSQKRKELAVLAGLGNTGFIGIPLCAVLFGPKGALLAAIFDAGEDVVLWTYVIYMLNVRKDGADRKHRKDRKHRLDWRMLIDRNIWLVWMNITWNRLKFLVNAPIIAIIAGLLLVMLRVEPPAVIQQVLGMFANVTVPLAMLYIGLLLAQLLRLRPQVRWTLLPMPIAVKLLVLPLTAALLLKLLPPGKDIADIVLVQTAMPTMTMMSIIFAKCSADEELAAVTTMVSTVLSVVTIPLVLAFFSS